MVTHYYNVAGHTFAISMPDNEKGVELPSYEPFVGTPVGTTELLFTLTVNDMFYPKEKGTPIGLFQCGAADFDVYRMHDATYQILICPPSGNYCAFLQVTPDFKEAIIATRSNISLRSFAVNNALMLLYAFAAAASGTLLVHASVIKNDGVGYLFIGKSGMGKSTHSSLWLEHVPGSELLNDDNPIVRIYDDEVLVYGSPWSGKTPCYKNDSARVGAFVQISQEAVNRITPALPIRAMALLLPSVSNMKWDECIYKCIYDKVSNLIGRVPVYILGCRPDREAAELCYAQMVRK